MEIIEYHIDSHRLRSCTPHLYRLSRHVYNARQLSILFRVTKVPTSGTLRLIGRER